MKATIWSAGGWRCVSWPAATLVWVLFLIPAETRGTLLADNRRVELRGSSTYYFSRMEFSEVKQPSAPFAPFVGTILGKGFWGDSSATQESKVSDLEFTARGSLRAPLHLNSPGSSGSATASALGRSVFDVTFSLATPHEFDATGTTGWMGGGEGFIRVSTLFSLEEVTRGSVFRQSFSGGWDFLDASGILEPGTYRLQVLLDGYASAAMNPESAEIDGAFDFLMRLKGTGVPEGLPAGFAPGFLVVLIWVLRKRS